MPKVSIVREDNKVYIDRKGMCVDCDGLPTFFHAIQWDGERGWIELVEDANGRKHSNIPISDFTPYQYLIDAWKIAKEELDRQIEKERQNGSDSAR